MPSTATYTVVGVRIDETTGQPNARFTRRVTSTDPDNARKTVEITSPTAIVAGVFPGTVEFADSDPSTAAPFTADELDRIADYLAEAAASFTEERDGADDEELAVLSFKTADSYRLCQRAIVLAKAAR